MNRTRTIRRRRWRSPCVGSQLRPSPPHEAAPRAAEPRYMELVEAIDGIVWEADARTFQFTFVSRKAEAILGYPLARWFEPTFWRDHVHPDDREQTAACCANATALGLPHALEYRMIAADGREVWMHDFATTSAEPGRPPMLRGVMVDISSRKQAEREREASLSLLQATLESTADGILVVDQRGRIVSWNEKFIALWRVPRELVESNDDASALRSVVDQLVEPEAFVAKVRELYEHPDAESFDVLTFKDGRVFERYSLPQRIGGRCVGRVWSFRDVTARHQAESERRRLFEELQTVLGRTQRQAAEWEEVVSSIVDGVIVADARGSVRFVNEATRRLAGVASIEELLRPLAEYPDFFRLSAADGSALAVEDMPAVRALRGETLRDEAMILHERSRGRPHFVRVSAAPVREGVAVIGAVIVVRDVSEQAEFDRLKDQFIGVAAHELKTPVTVLKGYAQLLLRASSGVPEACRGPLSAIDRGAGRIERIVDDLLDISQFNLGRLDLRHEPIDLVHLIERTVERAAARTKRHRLRVVDAAPVIVRGDPTRVEQVLCILLDNAIRYSPQGGDVEVYVSVQPDAATVAVRDHGVGIPPARQDRIFQRFYRAHTNTPHDYGGMGVGLYIANEIVTRLGGRMYFESEEGRGSTFHFSLPR